MKARKPIIDTRAAETRRRWADEELITDPRANQRPCEAVEKRLHHICGDTVPVSEISGEFHLRPPEPRDW